MTAIAVRLWQTNRRALPTIAALVIFVGMVIYGEAAYGRILQYNTVSNLLINNAHLVIIAVGMTFVILMGGIDQIDPDHVIELADDRIEALKTATFAGESLDHRKRPSLVRVSA